MLQFFRRKIAVWMMVVCSFSLTSCDEDTVNDVVDAILKFLGMMGWNLDSENANDQEKSDDTYDENTDGTLPSSVSLERYFPPIGI